MEELVCPTCGMADCLNRTDNGLQEDDDLVWSLWECEACKHKFRAVFRLKLLYTESEGE